MYPLHRGVNAGVEEDVESAEGSDGGVYAEVEGGDTESSGCGGEGVGLWFGEEAAHERAVAGAGHFTVVFGFEDHVEGVGRGGGEGGAGGEVEEGER